MNEHIVHHRDTLKNVPDAARILSIVFPLVHQLFQVLDDEVFVNRVVCEDALVVLEPVVAVGEEDPAFDVIEVVLCSFIVRFVFLPRAEVLENIAELEPRLLVGDNCVIDIEYLTNLLHASLLTTRCIIIVIIEIDLTVILVVIMTYCHEISIEEEGVFIQYELSNYILAVFEYSNVRELVILVHIGSIIDLFATN